jgi:hypothetical protein
VPLCKPREHRKPVNRQLFFIADVSMKNGITAPMMPIAEARCRHARTREGLKADGSAACSIEAELASSISGSTASQRRCRTRRYSRAKLALGFNALSQCSKPAESTALKNRGGETTEIARLRHRAVRQVGR